jgi:hypothetical protein
MSSFRTVARAAGMVLTACAFFTNVRPLSTPASDPTITQTAMANVGSVANAVVAVVAPDPAPIGPLPENVPSAVPSATPLPTRGAPYNPANNALPPSRGGPITIGVNGNVNVSRHAEFGGGSGASAASTGSDTSATIGASIDIARRTAQTTARVDLPTNLSGQGGGQIGGITGEYDTTKLSYVYGSQTISGLNLVPLGSTARGIAVISPLRHGGDVTLFAGPGQAGSPTFFARGVRFRLPVHNGFAGITIFDAKVENDAGRSDGISFGLANRIGALQTGSEVVVERNSDVAGVPNGITYAAQSRIDALAGLSAASLTLRDQNRNFESIGSSATTDADVYGELDLRRSSRNGSAVSLDFADEKSVTDEVMTTQRQSVTYDRRVGATGSGSLSVTTSNTDNAGSREWNGTSQLSYGGTFRNVAVQANVTASRQTTDDADPSASYGFGLGASKLFSQTMSGNAFYTYQQQTSAATGVQESAQFTVGLSRQFKKTSLLGQIALSHSSQTGTSDQRALDPSVTASRRISPVFTANVGVNGDFRRDRLNPSANAHTVGVNVSLGAPVAFGNGIVNGRINPKLPASIDGFVAQDGVSQIGSFGLTTGVSNILIVLDGTRSVRTDSRGQFSFQFITPGKHDVVIDPGSLPRGLTADQPSTSVTLQGGQNVHLALGVGTFGTVEGHLFGRDSKGAFVPVPDATVVLDDGTKTQTNAAGFYGFGRLLPGKHSVHVALDTVPANLELGVDGAKSVSVVAGERITVDFVGAALGSIEGDLVYDGSFDQTEAGKPVLNAYVVADPGDHAAIVDDYGHFVIDNLPAGEYSVSVDADTLPDDHGTVSETPLAAKLAAGGSVDKLHFTIGSKPRNVVFSFKQGDVNVLDVHVPLSPQPAGVGVPITVKTSEAATAVNVTGIGGPPVALTPTADKKSWHGLLHVSALARSGVIPLTVKAEGPHPGDGSASITINQDLQIAFFVLNPARPTVNQFVHVRARFFTEVQQGDRIAWSDGAVTVLGKPQGSIVSFDVKMAAVPYVGTLTAGGRQYRVVLRSR